MPSQIGSFGVKVFKMYPKQKVLVILCSLLSLHAFVFGFTVNEEGKKCANLSVC